MNRPTKIISSCLFAASSLAACGHSDTQTTVNQERTVMDNAAGVLKAPGLAKIAVRGSMDYQTGTVSNHLIDLVGNRTPADNERFQRTQAYLLQLIATTQPDVQTVTRPDGTRQLVTERFVNSNVSKRTYLFANKDQIAISQLAQGNGVTLNTKDQTNSLIFEDNNPNLLVPQIPNKVISEYTEICQSEVDIQTQVQIDTGTAKVLLEAFCFGFAHSVAAHQYGLIYNQYLGVFGNLGITRGDYKTNQYTASSDAYSSIPN